MKKNLLFISFSIVISSYYGQSYFELKGDKLDQTEFANHIINGPSKFDYSRIIYGSLMTLYIDEYDTKSIYNKFDLNNSLKQIQKDDRSNVYKKKWEVAFNGSLLKQMIDLQVLNKNISKLTESEKRKSLFLSYKKSLGLKYAIIWYFDDEMKETVLATTLINDYDLGNKNDIKLVLNNFFLFITSNTDNAFQKVRNEFGDAFNPDDKKKDTENKIRLLFSTEESLDNYNEHMEKLTISFLDKNNSYTLLIPEEYKEDNTEEALKGWKYSDYKFVSNSEIEKIRNRNDTNFAYIKYQKSTFIYLAHIVRGDDRVLFTYNHAKFFNAPTMLDGIIMDLQEKETRLVNKNGSMVYHKVEFHKNNLPIDLKTSRIVFVRMREHEHKKFNLYNDFVETLMKEYPYAYEIVDELPNDYDYRVFIRSTVSKVKLIMTSSYNTGTLNGNLFPNRGFSKSVEHLAIEDFYVYLEKKETKDLFKTPNSENKEVIISKGSDLFKNAIKNFIKEAKK